MEDGPIVATEMVARIWKSGKYRFHFKAKNQSRHSHWTLSARFLVVEIATGRIIDWLNRVSVRLPLGRGGTFDAPSLGGRFAPGDEKVFGKEASHSWLRDAYGYFLTRDFRMEIAWEAHRRDRGWRL